MHTIKHTTSLRGERSESILRDHLKFIPLINVTMKDKLIETVQKRTPNLCEKPKQGKKRVNQHIIYEQDYNNVKGLLLRNITTTRRTCRLGCSTLGQDTRDLQDETHCLSAR